MRCCPCCSCCNEKTDSDLGRALNHENHETVKPQVQAAPGQVDMHPESTTARATIAVSNTLGGDARAVTPAADVCRVAATGPKQNIIPFARCPWCTACFVLPEPHN